MNEYGSRRSLIGEMAIPFDCELWKVIENNINSPTLKLEDAQVYSNFKNIPEAKTSEFRSSKLGWIEDNSLKQLLMEMIQYYNHIESHWNFDLLEIEHCQYGVYNEGDHFEWHTDLTDNPSNVNGQLLDRKISLSIFLNDPDEYEGGEFDVEIKSPLKDVRYKSFKSPKGTVVIFPSYLWHRVRPITSGVRKTLVVWALGPPFR